MAAHLEKSFGSLQSQTHHDWELIAVDDGSTDDTLAWLRAQNEPRLRIETQPNGGVSAARNAGLKLARGRYIAFLDADDTWAPDFLERMLPPLRAGHAVLTYCGWQNLGVAGGRGNPFIPPDYEGPDKKVTLLTSNRWPIHAAVTRRELVLAASGFDTNFVVGEDFLLWLEIACFHHIQRVPHILAYYHHHAGFQASRDRGRAARQLLKVQETFLQRHPELVAEIGKRRIREITLGTFLKRGYDAYWKRDLDVAQEVFRLSFMKGGWSFKDLKYLLPAMLPSFLYHIMVKSLG